MSSRYPQTIHVAAEMAEMIDQPVDRAIISSRPGGGNTTQCYLKGDIIADNLNAVFGPLGWSSEAEIKQRDEWNELKKVTRNNQETELNMCVVLVVSSVKLTIKKTTDAGSDTVFVQSGIGYGEVEQGKSRREAVGMAVKGAETDGLKRCASLLGRQFGMMMASNGAQDDLEYAHNGKINDLRKARNLRNGGSDSRDTGENKRLERDDAHSRADNNDRGNARRTDKDRGEPRPRSDDRQRSSVERGDNSRRDPSDDRAGDHTGQRDNGVSRNDNQRSGERSPGSGRDERGRASADGRREQASSPREDTAANGEASDQGATQTKQRQVDTNYPLDSIPITKQDMTDFAATLIERLREMRQQSDRAGLVRQHLNTIKNLDSQIRRRTIERLRELDVDIDAISA